MEKGFNDDELADIMNEIESLEKEFSSDNEGEMKKQIETVETQATSEASEEHDSAQEEERVFEEPMAKDKIEAEAVESPEEKSGEKPEHKHGVQEEMNEVLGDLAQMKVEDVVPHTKGEDQKYHEENIHHLQSVGEKTQEHCMADHGAKQHTNHTAMSFHVEGEMKFELSFHISGKYVGLTVTEDGLEIGLDGGAKFTVPVGESHTHKKAS